MYTNNPAYPRQRLTPTIHLGVQRRDNMSGQSTPPFMNPMAKDLKLVREKTQMLSECLKTSTGHVDHEALKLDQTRASEHAVQEALGKHKMTETAEAARGSGDTDMGGLGATGSEAVLGSPIKFSPGGGSAGRGNKG